MAIPLPRSLRELVSDRRFTSRYVVMGFGSSALNLGVFWILYNVVHTWYLAAALVAYSARFVVKFVAVRLWLFGERVSRDLKEHFARYALLEFSYLTASLILLSFLVDREGYPPFLSLCLVIGVLYITGAIAARRFLGP